MKRRADYGSPADAFFDALDETLAPLARELRSLILRAVPDATEAIKWGMPVYEKNGPFCAIRCGKGYVALQFYAAGASLPDPQGLLEGTGKQMRHVKVRAPGDIRRKVFTAWLRQAAGQ